MLYSLYFCLLFLNPLSSRRCLHSSVQLLPMQCCLLFPLPVQAVQILPVPPFSAVQVLSLLPAQLSMPVLPVQTLLLPARLMH